MENKQMKCIKGESCLHCGSNYCRFVDELDQLKKTLTEIKELLLKTPTDSQMHCVNAKSVILQKISECEVNNGFWN